MSLPVWNLSDLYQSPTDEKLQADIAAATKAAQSFQLRYQGNLPLLTGDGLATAIKDYEALQERFGKIMSYAQLVFAADRDTDGNAQFYQNCQEQVNDAERHLLFFGLEICDLEDEVLAAHYNASPALLTYQKWLSKIRLFKPYQLSQELEELLHDKAITASANWMRLFDESMSALRFPYQGKMLSETEILHIVSTSKNEAERKEAALSFGGVLEQNKSLFTLILNTLAKDKAVEDNWRKFPHPLASRNLANDINDQAVDALIAAVRGSFGQLSHRYYKLKSQWLKKSPLDYWDRNAPLLGEDAATYTWDEAVQIVLEAYHSFSPELATLGHKFFDNAWIDADPRQGKDSGAFAHPTVPSVHPYLLVNFKGRNRDVMTLAHELGHGVHQLLSAEQGYLLADTPLTIAETASVFGEMLTFQSLLRKTTTPQQKMRLLAGKVEDMLNTVVRQIAFHLFEAEVHTRRQDHELSPQELSEIWIGVQQESLGDAFIFDDSYKQYWSYIPHFIHSPFYVYAYAFGDCLVNSLYAVYEQQPEGFAAKYLDLLKAGGSKDCVELLKPFNLNPLDPTFWQQGLKVVERFIDEVEALSNKQ